MAQLAYEMKTVLEDGIETTGAVCVDGAPAYGGVDATEDFDSLTIYALDCGDGEADDFIEQMPNIAFKGDRTPIEYLLDDNVIYQSNFTFEIRMPFHHTKTINGTVHEYSELASWYLERLQYVLDLWTPTSVMCAGKLNSGSMSPGQVDEESDIVYTAQTFFTIMYKGEGASQ